MFDFKGCILSVWLCATMLLVFCCLHLDIKMRTMIPFRASMCNGSHVGLLHSGPPRMSIAGSRDMVLFWQHPSIQGTL